MHTKWMGLPGLLVALPLFAATNMHRLSMSLCNSSRKNVHELWQKGLFVTTPAIAQAMLDAMDGDTTKVREALAAMPAKDAQRWRQSALDLAASAGQSATVDTLLNDGAKVEAVTYAPPLKPAFFKLLVSDAKSSRDLGGTKGVQELQKAGVINNKPRWVAPAILGAVQCDDLATVNVLLRHGADPMRQPQPHISDPFTMAILDGDADITQALVDKGAQPCAEDRRIAANWRRDERKPPAHTVASIGAKAGLPATLVQRLVCHAPPPTS